MQARREEHKKQQQERLTRQVQARRELDNVFRSTVSSSSRDRETRDRINLCFPSADIRQKQNFRQFNRRRSLDFGDLYHLHNLPKLATPEIEAKIEGYKKENPGVFSWEIRDR